MQGVPRSHVRQQTIMSQVTTGIVPLEREAVAIMLEVKYP